MKPTLLFSDIDGTLLTTQKHLSLENKAAIQKLVKQGGHLILSSGRPPESILEVATKEGLLFPGSYFIAYNGACIYDCDLQKNIYERVISMEDVALIEQAAKKFHIHIHTYQGMHIIAHEQDAELDFYQKNVHMDAVFSDQFCSQMTRPPFKMIAIHLSDHDLLASFQKHMNDLIQDRVEVLFSTPYYLEFLPKKAGKGAALQILTNHLGVCLSETVAVGDEENDISMIEAAGIGVAVQNARDRVKSSADYICTHTNDEHAIAEIIYRFML